MSATARSYTPAEAAAIGNIAIKAVNNAIDKRIVAGPEPRASKGDRRPARALSEENILQLKLWYEVGPILSPERRSRLFETIRQQPSVRMVKADTLIFVDVAVARKQIAQKMRELRESESMISQSKDVMGGEPVFRGTRIPVRLIAMMRDQGTDDAEILEGYPGLTRRNLELASLWTAAYPPRGRPRRFVEQGWKLTSVTRIPLDGVEPVSDVTDAHEDA